MASLLKGSAFITGAASGIGRQTAVAFAKHGITRLAVADINKAQLDTSIADLKKLYPAIQVLPLQLDVRDTEQVRQGIAETAKAFGRLDVAVNNAGIASTGRLTHETEDEEIERVLDVNLHGVYRCQKAELALMVKQEDLGPKEGRGRIVNVSSMYGLIAPNHLISYTPYVTAKHAIIGLTRGDANAYASFNIRINAISPGYVETPLIKAAMSSSTDSPLHKDLARTPLGRMASEEEIADAIVWLSSPMNSYAQGSTLVVDGGFTTN